MLDYRPIPIGVDNYKEIIDRNCAYVDKTLLIKEFWQDGSSVVLVPRPRRFGKTLNLSMLKFFFEKTDKDTSYLFEKTNIWAFPEYRSLQGQFPVIFLTFKDVRFDSWELAYEKLASIIAQEFKRLLHCIVIEKIGIYDIDIFNRIIVKSASQLELAESLQFLSRLLFEQTGKKVVLLIDEYDALITHAYLHGYYPKIVAFMRNLLSPALKTNDALERGFLTGITRTGKEGIFSGLNHLSVCTVLDSKYSDKFGFTQEEVDQLLNNYDLAHKRDEIKDWYDGYVFGQDHIYNPWSLLKCIESKGDLKPYWANTSNNDLIRELIASSGQKFKEDIELLLQGKEVVDQVDESVSLRDIKNNDQGLWSLFLFTGYLTATSRVFKDSEYYYTLALPNTEIKLLYEKLITQAINQTLVSGKITELFTALIIGDQYRLTMLLKEFVINSCSSFDLPKDDLERSLHMFVLGLLAGLSSRYIIKSNRESGHGRYDIMLTPRTQQDVGIIIEFKKSKNDDEAALSSSAQEALAQIKSKSYATDIRNFGYSGPIFCYGIAVCGKHVVINMEILSDLSIKN